MIAEDSSEGQISASSEHSGEPVVNAAAAVSLVLGSALLMFPAAVGRWLGVDSDRRVLRTIGLADLALAPGLYFDVHNGRGLWPAPLLAH
jgi:hypothetical protein